MFGFRFDFEEVAETLCLLKPGEFVSDNCGESTWADPIVLLDDIPLFFSLF